EVQCLTSQKVFRCLHRFGSKGAHSHGRTAAIHRNNGAINVGRAVTAEKNSDLSNILGITDTATALSLCQTGGKKGFKLGGLVSGYTKSRGHDRGHDHAGANRITANIVASEFCHRLTDNTQNAVFGDSVSSRRPAAFYPRSAGCGNNGAASALLEELSAGIFVAGNHRGGEQSKSLGHALCRQVDNRCTITARSSIVKHDIQFAKAINGGLNQGLNRQIICNIGEFVDHFPWKTGFQRIAQIILNIANDNGGSFGDKQLYSCKANSADTPGNNRDLICKLAHFDIL